MTYNFINHDLQYQNGIDFHVDWAASQFLSKNVQIGIAGYFFQQLTGDSGSGAKFGDFKGLDASLKPQLYWNAALDVRVRQPDGCSAPMSGHR